MLTFLVYVLFILSVAFAAAGIILSSKLRSRYKSGFSSTLMYFQAFIFTFGFYGIWGQLVIKTFLTDYISQELVSRFSNILLVLGLPFLVFAWFMLIKFSQEISGKKSTNWFIFSFLFVNFILILGVGYASSTRTDINTMSLLRYYFIILNSLYSLVASILILTPGRTRPVLLKQENRKASFLITVFMVLQVIALYFYKSEPVAGMIFILMFFAGNTFLPLFLSYGIKNTLASDVPVKDISFDDFCKRFEVSPRETDIIRGICNGLSNKEISDKLFISIQTVKDHTHRIYNKTNVRSRAQLMNIVKELREMK
jgi:DNA-binding CsgD family transcriptional regulator